VLLHADILFAVIIIVADTHIIISAASMFAEAHEPLSLPLVDAIRLRVIMSVYELRREYMLRLEGIITGTYGAFFIIMSKRHVSLPFHATFHYSQLILFSPLRRLNLLT
jgi:hypothetical protein